MAGLHFDEGIEEDMGFEVYAGDERHIGYFTNARIDRDTLPEGWHAYDLREGEDGEIRELKDFIAVNHAGTFLTKSEIDMGEAGSLLFDDGMESNSYNFDDSVLDEIEIEIGLEDC